MRAWNTVSSCRQPWRTRASRRTNPTPPQPCVRLGLSSDRPPPTRILVHPIFEAPCQWPRLYRRCREPRRPPRPRLPRSLGRIPYRHTMDDRRGNQSDTRRHCTCRCQRRRKTSKLKMNWPEVSAIRQEWATEVVDTGAAQKVQRDYKHKISSQSKKNFVLEKDVRYLDSRIALLIQNRMALEEVDQIPSFRSLVT